MHSKAESQPVIRYAGYDKKTGRIVHTHARFSVPENRYVEIPIGDLKARFGKEAEIVGKLSSGDPADLEFLKVELAHPGDKLGSDLIDPATRKVVMRPTLVVSADKRELVSDGRDSAKLEISLQDENGKPISGASGKVKITTQRGRLADRGGLIELVGGRGTTTLTSANETVSSVRVTATSLEGKFSPGYLDLEFV